MSLSREFKYFGWLSPTLLLSAKSLSTMVPLLSSLRDDVAFFHSVVFAAAGKGPAAFRDLAQQAKSIVDFQIDMIGGLPDQD